ncbi:hypothetical protein [Salinicola socius]|uniref:CopG family transcriptional regulator n=1 Tax=Salinicola socius TaxID=404433 RepID=A0A1Q8SUF7_9GAMM|nr:hypothetical protein [Salinicola socius]OLO05089.1 hypothetical protein BTW07_05605 [Salinicola socius]
MPEQTIEFDEQTAAVLDAVREREGLESRQQAAEFLLRTSIRESNARLTGRGRALYQVTGERH